MKHLPRHLAPILLRGARAVPALVVTGPRQSGKTTLVKALFADRPYVTLEDADERERAVGDPRTFLARHRDGAVFDEVQRAPELLSYLQSEVDRDPRPGRFVLIGSENLLLSERISQSLAGRCLIYRLLPFSVAESVGRAPSDPTRLHEPDYAPPTGPKVPPLDECLFRGGYPRAHEADIDVRGWLLTYQETYLERDVRQIQRVGDLDLFRRFMALCAGRSAQILNIASLANDAGVSAGTARSWLSILEATFVLTTLPSHHENFNKRVVRAPKLHFLDTGLLCSLLGVRSAADLGNHPLRGAIFETFAYSEFAKAFWNSGERPPLYYWRDKTGREVDLLVDLGIRRIPWECKAGATIRDDAFDGLRAWSRLAGVDPPCGGLACGAAASAPWREFVARGYGEIS